AHSERRPAARADSGAEQLPGCPDRLPTAAADLAASRGFCGPGGLWRALPASTLRGPVQAAAAAARAGLSDDRQLPGESLRPDGPAAAARSNLDPLRCRRTCCPDAAAPVRATLATDRA